MSQTRYQFSFAKKFILIIGVIIFWLSIFEIFSRYLVTNQWVLETTPSTNNLYWQLVWQKNHWFMQPGDTTDYSIDAHHPYLGWAPKRNSRTVTFNKTIASFNNAGIRGTKNYSLEKPPNTNRIVVVGDSFSFGEGVNDNETYSAALEKKLAKTEVLNLAVHGYGTDQMLLRLESTGLRYNPDLVIFAFVADDLWRNLLGFRDYLKPQFLLENNQLKLTNTPIPPPEITLQKLKSNWRIHEAFLLVLERWKKPPTQIAEVAKLAEAIWQQAINSTQAKNSKIVFLFLPVGEEIIDVNPEPLFGEKVLFGFCQKSRITCLSARKYFATEHTASLKFNLEEHYNPQAHEIIANGLIGDLLAAELLSPNQINQK